MHLNEDELNIWERMFGALESFHRFYGHSRVPRGWKTNPDLGRWVEQQRRWKRKGRLPPALERRLDTLGFEWTPPAGPVDAVRWERMYAQLQRFREKHGHSIVPVRKPRLRGLMGWVRHQRVLNRRGMLAPQRKARLDALGFAWNARDAVWEMRFAELLDFKKEHGHCDVLFRGTGSLGPWVRVQRVAKGKGTLEPSREARLEALGFSWQLRQPYTPEDRVSQVRAFRREHGHLAIPRHGAVTSLADWMKEQRLAQSKGTLPRDLFRQLDEVGFPWTPEEVEWEETFSRVLAHKHRTGQLPSGPRSVLGRWFDAQRQLSQTGQLAADAELRLAEIGAVVVSGGRRSRQPVRARA